MLWLWILLVLVLLTVLLCLTRVGVWAAFGKEGVFLDAKIGLLRVHILPAKPKKGKEPKPGKKPKKPKPPKEKKEEKPKLSIALEDVRDALHSLLPPLGRALKRLGRGIQFRPLRLSVTLGGREDPAASAQLYGELQAAVWTGMPLLERLVDIWEPHIHTGVDFGAGAPAVEGEIGVTLRIGTLFAMGFGVAVPALKWFLRWRKRCRNRPPEPEKKDAEEPKEPAA